MCVFLLRFRILLLGLSFVHNTNEQGEEVIFSVVQCAFRSGVAVLSLAHYDCARHDCIFAQTDKQTAHQLRVDSTLEGFPVH
eukprot:m.274378 g.274378  ORF g.274378 m.274378 type:complete len:82 (+) comp15686_c1_seq29:67-312(+)